MKKIILILISVFLFVGCASQDKDFALKETCAKYVKDAQNRGEGYEGTYYSKGKSTCVSVYYPLQGDDPEIREMSYYDEFTGKWRWFNRKDFEIEKQRLEFEKELQLAW